jgi:quinol-cytochrome oxidoreductase complex cytochrome b subunit
MRPNFFLHLHPPTIPAGQARWRYTLGAGGMAVFLSLVLAVTGALEMFYYVPTPAEAGLSIQTLTFLVPYGWLVRNLHYWSAQMLMVVTGVHLVRVVFTGAYAPPRRFNYLLGLGMLVTAFLLNFTGYVLRWDDGIRWALVVGTNLLKTIPLIGDGLYGLVVGGPEPGAATIVRFYAWHIFGLALLFIILGAWHIFRVRRDGGIAVPPPALRGDHERIPRVILVRREVLAMLFTGTALLLLATAAPAPLAAPIGDLASPLNEARAPWFFLWVQQLLKLGSPFFWGVAVPLLVVAVLAGLPYTLPLARPEELGRWFPRTNRAAQVVTALVVLGLAVLTLLALLPPDAH